MNTRPLPHLLSSPQSPSSPTTPAVPPPGPVWYPSVMGTGILANLLALHAERIPGAAPLSFFLLITCWTLLLGLTSAFIVRTVVNPRVLIDALTQPAQIPFWGTVSMGILSAGAALTTSLPLYFPELVDFAWTVDAYTWAIGAAIGILSALNFAIRAYGSTLGSPNFVWGLAVVGPMVSATVGSNLSAHVSAEYGPMILLLSMAGFVVTFTLGSTIFFHAYALTWRHTPLPLAASASSWIPLGLVGQSAAAAQAGAFNAEAFAHGSLLSAAHMMANWYGWTMMVIGTPLTLWASYVTIRGILKRMPFSPGWWATTFPIGTMSLGSTLMAHGTEQPWLLWLGAFGTVVLVGTVTFSASGSISAILRVRRG